MAMVTSAGVNSCAVQSADGPSGRGKSYALVVIKRARY
jgi:hypothetical protein